MLLRIVSLIVLFYYRLNTLLFVPPFIITKEIYGILKHEYLLNCRVVRYGDLLMREDSPIRRGGVTFMSDSRK